MTILNGTLSQLGSIAATLASAIIPGASEVESLVKAGKAVADAFHTVKDANGGTAPADAEKGVHDLVTMVNKHADSTLGRLEGDES